MNINENEIKSVTMDSQNTKENVYITDNAITNILNYIKNSMSIFDKIASFINKELYDNVSTIDTDSNNNIKLTWNETNDDGLNVIMKYVTDSIPAYRLIEIIFKSKEHNYIIPYIIDIETNEIIREEVENISINIPDNMTSRVFYIMNKLTAYLWEFKAESKN